MPCRAFAPGASASPVCKTGSRGASGLRGPKPATDGHYRADTHHFHPRLAEANALATALLILDGSGPPTERQAIDAMADHAVRNLAKR